MHYVDGYVLTVPKKRLKEYQAIAHNAGKVWMKCGALRYMECVGDDIKPDWATIFFPQMVKAKPGEVVLFSFIIFKSRAHRDRVNAKVFKDPFMNPTDAKKKKEFENMPADMKRMAYGGFKAIVDL